jgi:dihydrofolate reductase
MEICLVCVRVASRADGHGRAARWHDAAELNYFGEVARNHPVVMGRRTWEALPGGLPGRQNIVLTSLKLAPRGAIHCETLPEALTLVSVLKPAKVFLLGGAGLFAKARSIADRLYVARIGNKERDADASEPDIDPRQFALADRVACGNEDSMQVVVEEYRRLRSMH